MRRLPTRPAHHQAAASSRFIMFSTQDLQAPLMGLVTSHGSCEAQEWCPAPSLSTETHFNSDTINELAVFRGFPAGSCVSLL